MYLAGGNNGDSVLTKFEEYDLKTGRVKTLEPMRAARDELCLVELKGQLYAIGGGGSKGQSLKSVERYDFALERWTSVANLFIQRRSPAVVATENRIYVTGGFDGNSFLCSIEM